MPARHPIILGQKFHRLTVIKQVPFQGPSSKARRLVLCRCDCGNERIVPFGRLVRDEQYSCGCYGREQVIKSAKTHGLSKTHVYRSWINMMRRCYKSKGNDYRDYQGRGIKVCKRWRVDFLSFMEDMGSPPPGWTLERVNVNGNYKPSNCIWATPAHQATNTRKNIFFTIDGQTKHLSEWCRIYGMAVPTVWRRINECGMEPVVALTKPPRKMKTNTKRLTG